MLNSRGWNSTRTRPFINQQRWQIDGQSARCSHLRDNRCKHASWRPSPQLEYACHNTGRAALVTATDARKICKKYDGSAICMALCTALARILKECISHSMYSTIFPRIFHSPFIITFLPSLFNFILRNLFVFRHSTIFTDIFQLLLWWLLLRIAIKIPTRKRTGKTNKRLWAIFVNWNETRSAKTLRFKGASCNFAGNEMENYCIGFNLCKSISYH